MLPKELEQADGAAIEERLQRMRSRMSLSQASGMTGFPRTYTNATNAPSSSDSEPSNDRVSMSVPRGRTGSVTMSPNLYTVRRDMSPTIMRRERRDSSPTIMRRERRDSSPSAVRIDVSMPPPRRHQRSMSSGASSMESPATNPAALSFALNKLAADRAAEQMPPVTSKLSSHLPGLSPLPESDFSRRGTIAEPEQMEMSRTASRVTQAEPEHKLERARSD